MMEDIDRILWKEDEIQSAVKTLAQAIEKNYRGRPLVIVAILNGSFMFLSDLTRQLHLPLRIECIYAQSYGGETNSSGECSIIEGKDFDVNGADTLVVDDILDTGLTLSKVKEHLVLRGAHEIRTAVMIRKAVDRQRHVEADYCGLNIGNEFVVGYGLDYKGYYRNLPFLATLKPSAIAKKS